MKLLAHKTLMFLALTLFTVSCSCSGEKDEPASQQDTSSENTVSDRGSPPRVAPENVGEANMEPTVSHADIDEVIYITNQENYTINFSISDDSDDVTTSLYHSKIDGSCNAESLADWTLHSSSEKLEGNFDWSTSESGIYYLCLVANDSQLEHYLKINSVFLVIPSDAALWLKADVGVIESSGAVARWNDQSGNSRDFIANSETNKPTLKENSINGNNTIYFDGLDDFLSNSDNFDVQTSIAVFRVDSSKQQDQLAEIWGDYLAKAHVAVDARAPGKFSFDGKSPSPTKAKYYLEGKSFSSPIANGSASQSWSYDVTNFLTSEFNSLKSANSTNLAHPMTLRLVTIGFLVIWLKLSSSVENFL